MKSTLLIITFAVSANAQSGCTSNADCVGMNMTSPRCVKQYSGGQVVYSECVDCYADSFQTECLYMSDGFLDAAVSTCQEPCDLRCNQGACTNSTLTCVTSSSTDRCYDCTSQEAFQAQCYSDEDSIIIAAEAQCGFDCEGRCPNHKDSDCEDGLVCVVQANGLFDQCVNCDPGSFEYDCQFWSEEIVAAAEDTCGLTCSATTAKLE